MVRAKVYDRLLITWARSDKVREDVLAPLESIGALGGIIVQEPHSEQENDSAGAEASEARPFHLHAAIYGNFPAEWKRAVKDLFPDCSVFAQHTHVHQQLLANGQRHPQAGQFKATYHFPAMVKYLTAPQKDKVLDKDPLYFGCESADQLLELYSSFRAGDTFDMLADAKENKVPRAEVIRALADVVTRDTAYLYRTYMDYYDAFVPPKRKILPPDFVLRPWQKMAVGFASMPVGPIETTNTGLWLNVKPGEGKTLAMCAMHDHLDAYIPFERPGGGYDSSSLSKYDGQGCILFNDLACSTQVMPDGEIKYCWKKGVLSLLKQCHDPLPIAFKFGNTEEVKYVRARIIVTSNFPLPVGYSEDEAAAFRRRMVVVSSTDDIAAIFEEYGLIVPLFESVVEPAAEPTAELEAADGLANLRDWVIEAPVVQQPFGAPPSSPPGLRTRVMAARPQETGSTRSVRRRLTITHAAAPGSSTGVQLTSPHFGSPALSVRRPLQPRAFVPPRQAAASPVAQRPRVNGFYPGFYPEPLSAGLDYPTAIDSPMSVYDADEENSF